MVIEKPLVLKLVLPWEKKQHLVKPLPFSSTGEPGVNLPTIAYQTYMLLAWTWIRVLYVSYNQVNILKESIRSPPGCEIVLKTEQNIFQISLVFFKYHAK